MANQAETTITLTDAPDDEDRAVIMDGLRGYNETQAGGSDACPLAILVRDPETRKVAGGLFGPHIPRPPDGRAVFPAGGFETWPTR